ncbi:MAG: hypothetical protein ACYDEP_14110, partial [Acidimicrobiales bacterium]
MRAFRAKLLFALFASVLVVVPVLPAQGSAPGLLQPSSANSVPIAPGIPTGSLSSVTTPPGCPPVLITPKSEASIAEAPTRRDSHSVTWDRANGKSLVLFGGRG